MKTAVILLICDHDEELPVRRELEAGPWGVEAVAGITLSLVAAAVGYLCGMTGRRVHR